MSSTTPVAGLIIPENSDILNAESTFGQFATGVDGMGLPRFTSVALLQAANPSPTEGQMAVIYNATTTNANIVYWNGFGWKDFEDRRINYLSSSQSVTSSTTLVDITALTFTDLPLGAYLLEGVLHYTGAEAGDLKLGFTQPSGTATFLLNTWGPAVGGVAAGTNISGQNIYSTTALSYGCLANGAAVWLQGQFQVTAVSTVVKFQFAQNTANATPTALIQGSYISLRVV